MRAPCLVVLFTSLLVIAFVASTAHASCAVPTPMFHGADSYFQCEDMRPVAAFAYQQGSPAGVNTDGVRIACEATDAVFCFGMSGVVGDWRVTIETDWMTPGIDGCPISPLGPQRVVIVVATGGRLAGTGLKV